jgi:hypothetical protein
MIIVLKHPYEHTPHFFLIQTGLPEGHNRSFGFKIEIIAPISHIGKGV